MAPKLSNPSKMPCFTWSLPAIVTCPGALDASGALVPACSGCYAAGGRYNMPNVAAPRDHNLDDWKRDGWADDMVALLDGESFFRWFDSGDVYDPALAGKILLVMLRTPNVRHWLPTRAYKDDRILPFLRRMAELPNVVVRYSSDGVNGERIAGATTSTIVQSRDDWKPGRGEVVCTSSDRGGKCGPCRACWSPKVAVVSYVVHGHKVSAKEAAARIARRAEHIPTV
jgi:hypothetical protein